MKISIITACHNSAGTIAHTLKSVREQTYGNIEHIVVDGGSTDDTLRIVTAEGAHVAKLVSERDNGIYDAMNRGIELATGDVAGFLNSDGLFSDEDIVSRIAQTMLEQSIDACYGDLAYVSQADTNKVICYRESYAYDPGLCTKGRMPAHPTFYARRTVNQRYGAFDLNLKLQADFQMALRLLNIAGIRTMYLPEVLVHIGGASNASLRNVLQGNLGAARACRKHGLPGGLEFIAGKLLLRIPQFLRHPPTL